MVSSRDQVTWLTLSQASQRLGIHPTTLRAWVDSGIVKAYLTPGGHRRFLSDELEDFIQRRRADAQTNLPALATDQALQKVRQQLGALPVQQQAWYSVMTVNQQEIHRETGRHLLGLLLQFVSRHDNTDQFLGEARKLATQYGTLFASAGLSIGELARAFLFFHRMIVNAAFCPTARSLTTDAGGSRLLQHINVFMDELLIAALEAFISSGNSPPLPDSTSAVERPLASS